MTPAIRDHFLYLVVLDGDLQGVMGIYMDENLNTGRPLFERLTDGSLEQFDSKPWVFDDFDFFESTITATDPDKFFLSQQ